MKDAVSISTCNGHDMWTIARLSGGRDGYSLAPPMTSSITTRGDRVHLFRKRAVPAAPSAARLHDELEKNLPHAAADFDGALPCAHFLGSEMHHETRRG